MVKKSPSNAVKSAVKSAVKTEVAEITETTKGSKKFTTEQYLTEYMKSHANGETWKQLCDRTGFSIGNVRQCITMLRSEYREAKQASAEASAAFLKQLKSAGMTVEVWAHKKAEEKIPYLKGSTERNTQKAQLRASWQNEELSL